MSHDLLVQMVYLWYWAGNQERINGDRDREEVLKRWPGYLNFTKINISIGNSMICSDIWHKYHKWYFKIVIRNFSSWNLRQFWNITSGIYAKYHLQIMLLFVYTTTCKRFVIFTCRYFKLSWNTTARSQSNCGNFSRSSIRGCNIK